MEENIRNIMQEAFYAGGGTDDAAKDTATHVTEFIEFTHDRECPFILTDDGWQKVGEEGFAYFTINEVYQYWRDNIKEK